MAAADEIEQVDGVHTRGDGEMLKRLPCERGRAGTRFGKMLIRQASEIRERHGATLIRSCAIVGTSHLVQVTTSFVGNDLNEMREEVPSEKTNQSMCYPFFCRVIGYD